MPSQPSTLDALRLHMHDRDEGDEGWLSLAEDCALTPRSGVLCAGLLFLALARGIETTELVGGDPGRASVSLGLFDPEREPGSMTQSFERDRLRLSAPSIARFALSLSLRFLRAASSLLLALSALMPSPRAVRSSSMSTAAASLLAAALSEKSHEYRTPSTMEPCSL